MHGHQLTSQQWHHHPNNKQWSLIKPKKVKNKINRQTEVNLYTMGGVFCALAAKVFRFDAKKRHLSASVLIAGLPASGKTTVLCKLIWLQQHHHGLKRLDFKRYDFKRRDGKASFKTSPTVGFNVEEVKCHHTKMTIWEVGSSDYMRWSSFYQKIKQSNNWYIWKNNYP